MKSRAPYRWMLILGLIGLIATCTLAQGSIRTLLFAGERASGTGISATVVPAAGMEAQGRMSAQVTRVVDGDTIDVLIGGQVTRVRYIGINAPESVKPDHAVERMGHEASATNRALVDGKTVYLERDVSDTDSYGRLLRYVYVDDLFVNAELVRLGLAEARRYPPDLKHQSVLDDMESEARAARRGIWSTDTGTAHPSGE